MIFLCKLSVLNIKIIQKKLLCKFSNSFRVFFFPIFIIFYIFIHRLYDYTL